MVRQEAGANSAVLGRHAEGLVQSGTVAHHLRTAVLHTSAERSLRAPGRLVRPAVRQRLVPDAAEAVRGRVQDIHVGPVHRRSAQVEPSGLGHRCRAVVVADRAAEQRTHRVHYPVHPGRVENDAVAERPF